MDIMAEAPTPCSIRLATSVRKSCEKAQANDAMVKTERPAR